MGNRTVKIVLFLILVVVLLFLLVKRAAKEEKKTFKKITIEQTNKIQNLTSAPYLDTIIAVGLKNLKIENVTVLIFKLNKEQISSSDNSYDFRAHIRGVGNFYYIWIDNMSRSEYISVLSHELIHLRQYHERRLIYDDDGFINWQGKKYELSKIEYKDREWENEAFRKEVALKQMMLLDLY